MTTRQTVEDKGIHSLQEWRAAARKAVERGTKIIDICSEDYEREATALIEDLKSAKGYYEALVLKGKVPVFLNFIVLEYRGGFKEVWFGWLMAQGYGDDQRFVRFNNPTVVSSLSYWHREIRAEIEDQRNSGVESDSEDG